MYHLQLGVKMGTRCCILWLLMLTTTAQAYKSCSELQGKNESAPHKIELGGVEYNVLCNMSSKPPETIIKVLNGDDVKITDPEKYSKEYSFIRDIQYSDLPIKAIKELVELSENCRQFVSYHCKNASLFGNQSSLQSCWSSFGGDCNFYWGGCDAFKQNCKCDSGTSKDDTDQGLLTKKNDLPVVQVRVGGLKTNSNVSFTIGDLICYGDYQKGALTLQDRNSFISMNLSSIDGQEIKFKFKSSASNRNKTIATVHMKNKKYVKIGLNSKNQLEVSHTFGSDLKQPLMEVDEEWHGVTVKIAQNSVYVRFDNGKLAPIIENGVHSSVEKLVFGELAQTCESFIGCVKDLYINDIDYTKQLHDSSAKENVTNGCEQVKTFVCTIPTKTGGDSGDDNDGKKDKSTKSDGGKSTAKPDHDGDDGGGGDDDGDNTAIIVIVVIFILLLILLLVAFFITWYLKRNKGVYQTHEGSAEDIHGDTDNLTLVTKSSEQDPEGEKSKEYYL